MKVKLFIVIFSILFATSACTAKTELASLNADDADDDSSTGFTVLTDLNENTENDEADTESDKTEEEDSADDDAPVEIDYQKVKPYEVGRIMIIMYHGIEDAKTASDQYQRTAEEFKNDLMTLYEEGFYLLSMRDYANNNINIEAGKSPVVLSFDDGLSSAFSLVLDNGKLVPRPGCAVDILNKFCEEHPDFGKAAIFFVNKNPFPGDGSVKDAFEYLVENGYEIGNHTYSHKELNKLTADEISTEVGMVEMLIQDNLPGYETCALSYPYGIRPAEDELKSLCLNGAYEGIEYNYKVAVREGQSTSPSAPNRVGYDNSNVPRVRGSDNAETDLWWSIRSFRGNPDLKYVSDGNPSRISVPEEYQENIDSDNADDKEIFIYSRKTD